MSDTQAFADADEDAAILEARLNEILDQAEIPENEGRIAYQALAEYQRLAAENLIDLESDENYREAGFETRKDFEATMRYHARVEAGYQYNDARRKKGWTKIDEHPCFQLEEAYEWILKSGDPLFHDDTYEFLGTTRENFFKEIQNGHIDAVRGKVKALRHAVADGLEYEVACTVLDSIYKGHFVRLGIDVSDVQGDLAKRMGTTSEELDELNYLFNQRRFRAIIRHVAAPAAAQAVPNKKLQIAFWNAAANDNNAPIFWGLPEPAKNPRYRKLILQADDILKTSDEMKTDPATFEGLAFNASTFADEVERCVEAALHRHLSVYNKSGTLLRTAERVNEIIALRERYPEDVEFDASWYNLNYSSDDYWYAPVFRAHGYRTYTDFRDQAAVAEAAGWIGAALKQGSTNASYVDAYSDLLQAEARLYEADYLSGNHDALNGLSIDGDAFKKKILISAPYAAVYHWELQFCLSQGPLLKLESIRMLEQISQRLKGKKLEAELPFDEPRLLDQKEAVTLRYAEEKLADSCIAVDAQASFNILHDAMESLAEAGGTLDEKYMSDALFLDQDTANAIVDRYFGLKFAEDWLMAQDEDVESKDRLAAAARCKTLYYEKANGRQKSLLEARVPDLEDPEKIITLLRERVEVHFQECMKAFADVDHSPVQAIKHLDAAREALELIVLKPAEEKTEAVTAFNNGFAFARATSGQNHAKFLDLYQTYKKKVEALKNPVPSLFKPDEQAVQDLRNIMSTQETFKTFDKIAELARQLREDGRTIMSRNILNAVGHTPVTFQKYADNLLLQDAAAHIQSARKNSGSPMTGMQDMPEHSYVRMMRAFSCMLLRTQPVLSDGAWQSLGYADRNDFVQNCRKELRDLQQQMELLILPDALNKGPVEYFAAMEETLRVYHLLGADKGAYAQDYVDMLQKVQKSLSGMGHAACNQILAKALPVSAQYKQIINIREFSASVGMPIWSEDKDPALEAKINNMAQQRIEKLLKNWAAHPGDEARGVHVARAIGKLRDRHNLDQFAWFTDIWSKMGLNNFDHFAQTQGWLRLQQLIVRIRDGKTSEDPALQVSLLDDIDRIDELVEHGLLSEQVKNDIIIREHKLPVEWTTNMRHRIGIRALPVLVLDAADPTLDINTRLAHLTHIEKVKDAVGDAYAESMGIYANDVLHRDLRRRRASIQIFTNAMHDVESMTHEMVSAIQDITAVNEKALSDPLIIQSLGLSAQEAQRLNDCRPYIPAFTALQTLLGASADSFKTLHMNTILFYKAASECGLNFMEEEPLQKIGFESVADFREVVDTIAFFVVGEVQGGIEKIKNPLQLIDQIDHLVEITKIMTLEERYPAHDFAEKGLLTIAQLNEKRKAASASLQRRPVMA